MIFNTASVATQWFLDGVSNLQRQEAKTQRDISTGFRIHDASDSPSQTPQLISLISALATTQLYQTNIGRVQAEVSSADTALGSAITLIESARSIALQGASTATTASDRLDLATQVQGIQEQLVGIANTTAEGRYIFGGDQDLTPPYQLDPTSPSGVDQLTSQPATRVINDLSGQPIYQARDASAIFDDQSAGVPTANNAFQALQDLLTSLQSNNPAGVATALTSLESVSDWLNQQQAYYGVVGSRLSQEQTSADSRITTVKAQISSIRDTDVVQAATDLTQENTAQSAAYSAEAQISRKSLFDYLG